MKYSIDTLHKANSVMEKRRRKALEQFEENKKIAYSKIPDLSRIDDELSSSGMLISNEILNKKNNIQDALLMIRQRNEQLISEKKRLLDESGLGEDFLSIKYNCKKCNDTGYVDAMPCDCLNEVIAELAANKASRIGADEEASFESFDLNYYPGDLDGVPCKAIMAQTLENCKNYAEEFSSYSPNLLLFGGTGVGKTHISKAIAKKVAENGFDVIYMSAPDLFTALEKERFSQETPAENMNSIVKCELLVIDDLGAEPSIKNGDDLLYTVINERYANNLPILITTNLSKDQVSVRYEDRIFGRIYDKAKSAVIIFNGKDLRIE